VTTTLDFDDGNGPQPAARHRNPDGSDGGWVAATASVAPSAYVSHDAHVFGRARIEDGCEVGYFSRVYEDAHLESGSEVEGPVYVCGRARLTRRAHLAGPSHVHGDAVLSGFMSGYTTLAGDSFVAEGVWIMPLARIIDAGRIESSHHYFCGFGGPIKGHWTFYRGQGSKVWLCLSMSCARPVDHWIARCDQVGAGQVIKHVSGTSLRAFLESALSMEALRDW
jgi:hypothetical protein